MVQHMGRACPCKKRRGDQTDGQRDEPHSQAHGAAKKEAGQENHGNPIAISGERKHQSVQFSTANPGTSAKRSEEHTSELQSLMRISYAVFCLKKKKT